MEYQNLKKLKEKYDKGINITSYIKELEKDKNNSLNSIEISYDLQAGSYIDFVKSNRDKVERIATKLSEILTEHLENGDSLLDVGTGEVTTLTLVLNELNIELSDILALDISWSRLSVGMNFHRENRKIKLPLKPFVADIKENIAKTT